MAGHMLQIIAQYKRIEFSGINVQNPQLLR